MAEMFRAFNAIVGLLLFIASWVLFPVGVFRFVNEDWNAAWPWLLAAAITGIMARLERVLMLLEQPNSKQR